METVKRKSGKTQVRKSAIFLITSFQGISLDLKQL